MLELYNNDMSVCAAKVRIVLAEKGLEWKEHRMNLRAGDTWTPEYLRINPNGVVPTLVDDGRILIESNVILMYLDEKWPEPPLQPTDPFARARMRLWMKQLDDSVHAATGTASTCVAFRHQHLRKTKEEIDAYFAKVPEERRVRMRQAIEQGVQAPVFAGAVKRFDKLVADFETALAEGPWLAGDRYSLAEVAYTPYLIRMELLGFEQMFAKRPRATDWKARVLARPSYETAVKKWFSEDALALLARERDGARAKVAEILG